jgi:hypothetical protein
LQIDNLKLFGLDLPLLLFERLYQHLQTFNLFLEMEKLA